MGIYDATTGGWGESSSTVSKNTWVHLGFTATTSAKKFYINGSLDSSATGSTYGYGTANAHNRIGARNDNSHGWLGYLDQTLMWNKEVSAQEMADLNESVMTMLKIAKEDPTDDLMNALFEAFSMMKDLNTLNH